MFGFPASKSPPRGPGLAQRRPHPAGPRSLPAPRPLLLKLPLFPTAEPRARLPLPAAENLEAPLQTARVSGHTGSGDGPGAGRSRPGPWDPAAGLGCQKPAGRAWRRHLGSAREWGGSAPARGACPPRPPGARGGGVGVKGKAGELARTVRGRQGRGVEGSGKRPGEKESSLLVPECSLEGRVAAAGDT